MKKIILAVLFSAITIIGFTQTPSYAYKLETGVWNTYTEKWNWNDAVDIDLTFTLAKTYVKINDQAHTYLSIIEQDGAETDNDRIKSVAWTCNDEKNRRCTFMITLFKETNTITYVVMYNDKCFRYYIKRGSRIDNFN
jgi:hypothetical protein